MPAPDTAKRFIGCEIDVDRRDGRRHHGRLVNVTRRSLWLVDGDADCFIAIDDILDLRLAG